MFFDIDKSMKIFLIHSVSDVNNILTALHLIGKTGKMMKDAHNSVAYDICKLSRII